jgi:hypothetical protein
MPAAETTYNSCFTGSGRVRALRRNLRPVTPRAGARVPLGPKFGKACTLTERLSGSSR